MTAEKSPTTLADQCLAKLPRLDLRWPDDLREAWFNSARLILDLAQRHIVLGEREWQSWVGELEYQSWL